MWSPTQHCTSCLWVKFSEWHSDASWKINLILLYMPGPIWESQSSLSWGVHNACVVQSCCHQFLVKLTLSHSGIVALIYQTTRIVSYSLLAERIPKEFLRNQKLFQRWDFFQFVKLTERSFLNIRHKKIFHDYNVYSTIHHRHMETFDFKYSILFIIWLLFLILVSFRFEKFIYFFYFCSLCMVKPYICKRFLSMT